MAKLKYLENEKRFCVVLTESVRSMSVLQNKLYTNRLVIISVASFYVSMFPGLPLSTN